MSWPTVPLATVAEVKLGRQRSPKNHIGPMMRKYLRAANVGWSGLQLDDVNTMNFTAAEMEVFRLVPGDILLSEASGTPTEVGKPAIWNGEIADCAFQNTLLRVRSGPEVNSRYLLQYFSYQAATAAFARGSRGAGINHLGRDALAKWPVPLPPLNEQARIAAILELAICNQSRRHEIGDQIDSLEAATFASMFGSRSELLTRWPTKTLGELLDFLTSGSRGWARYYSATGAPFLRIQNVGRNSLSLDDLARVDAPATAEAKRTKVAAGDVLLSITADLGRTAVVPEGLGDAYINQHLAILRCESIDANFLSAFLSSTTGQRQLLKRNRQGVKAGLNFDDIRSIEIPLPPAELQAEFSEACTRVSLARARNVKAINLDKELLTSLRYRAFTGQL